LQLTAERLREVQRRKDDKFLEAAIGGSVQYIVTGDEDLLVLDGNQGLKIIKPKQFLTCVSK